MNADYFRTMVDYGYWARDRLMAAAEGMSDAEYAKENGFTCGSIRGILLHVLGSEAVYAGRWRGETVDPLINHETAPILAALIERWRQEEEATRAYLSKLGDADVEREIVSRRRNGEEFRRPLWQDITQIINHGTQHRSEAAEALTMIGRSPGNLDVSVYFSEKAAPTVS